MKRCKKKRRVDKYPMHRTIMGRGPEARESISNGKNSKKFVIKQRAQREWRERILEK